MYIYIRSGSRVHTGTETHVPVCDVFLSIIITRNTALCTHTKREYNESKGCGCEALQLCLRCSGECVCHDSYVMCHDSYVETQKKKAMLCSSSPFFVCIFFLCLCVYLRERERCFLCVCVGVCVWAAQVHIIVYIYVHILTHTYIYVCVCIYR